MLDAGVAEDLRSAHRGASPTPLKLILETFDEEIRKLEDAMPGPDALKAMKDLICDNEVLEENILAYDAALREVIEHTTNLRAQNAALTVQVARIPKLERLLAQEREASKQLALDNQTLADKNAELLTVMHEALACDDGLTAASAHYDRHDDATRGGSLHDSYGAACAENSPHDALRMDNVILGKESDMLRNLLFGIYGGNDNPAD